MLISLKFWSSQEAYLKEIDRMVINAIDKSGVRRTLQLEGELTNEFSIPTLLNIAELYGFRFDIIDLE